MIGKKLPQFILEDLFNKNTKLDTSVWANKDFIVLNIWASWCVPCQIEHPFLMSLKDKNKINIIGLNYKDESKNASRKNLVFIILLFYSLTLSLSILLS